MRHLKALILCSISSVVSPYAISGLPAEENNFLKHEEIDSKCGTFENCQFGSATFRTFNPSDWYAVIPPPFPAITPLSLNRNEGFKEGKIHLRPYGITIHEKGNYVVNFTAVVQNPDAQNGSILPVFVALNGEINPQTSIINIAVIQPEGLANVVGNGILKNVKAGTKISLFTSNTGGAPQPINVVGWNINLHKIPCKTD